MKNSLLYILTMLILLSMECKQKEYRIMVADNPVYKPNTIFRSFEDLHSPKFKHLRDKYQLDTVIDRKDDELTQILKLREWIHRVIKIDVTPGRKYSGKGYAEGILDAALEGAGFHCGHFMIVQNAILNAYGFVTRCLGAGPGVPGVIDSHHGLNEVWLNSYNKWFMCDAKYNHHFEKDGVPLSALEIRDEYLKNKASGIQMIKGIRRVPTDFDDEFGRNRESFARTYTWVEWDAYNDRFTVWPDFKTLLIMYEDDYFKTHEWLWDGKPHWAYDTEFLIAEPNRDAIEWSPNVIASKVVIDGDIARIELKSDTPNLKEYQIKRAQESQWTKSNDVINMTLNERSYNLSFRAVNLAGIAGPEHRVVIRSDESR